MLSKRVQGPRDDQRGFTLVELLVVVIVIGILAAIAIPALLSAQAAAKDAAPMSDLANLKSAVAAVRVNTSAPAVPATTSWSRASDLPLTLTNAGSTFSASTTSLKYVAGTDDDYCLQALSATGRTFAATNRLAIARGSCTASGSFQSAGS